ncbi:filamentous hemagglutinin N-terminal domain-containing protein [Geitlerinema sp. CS-897]|nr:filamentous hemagglutinin N-terminal domain-containing protein [Geitlerinema sp. CS-897]
MNKPKTVPWKNVRFSNQSFNLRLFAKLGSSALLALLNVTPALGQIVPDRTLPSPSQVSIEGNTSTLNGGTEAGNNLFHSFDSFSVPTGTEAFFNNAASIENILTRVTGSNISNIDGLIRANGTANLFLLNPNGIVFGENARLDIGGSFFGTTASSIVFNDGVEFSATHPETDSLLTVSVPVGLQFASSVAAIGVEGIPIDTSALLGNSENDGNPDVGLRVQPDRTLALVGGRITLDGALLAVSDGRIELGAVETGNVGLRSVPSGWSLDYSDTSSFGDIQLLNRAFASTDGAGTSFIQVRGRTLEIRDGSGLQMLHSGAQPDGTLTVNLSDRLILNGTIPDTSTGSVLRSWTREAGDGADIYISARQLEVTDGSSIVTATFGEGRGGDQHIHAADSVVLDVVTSNEMFVLSSIFSNASGLGEGGNIDLTTQRLIIGNNSSLYASNGNLVVSSQLTGSAGDITINASESVELIGAPFSSSTIFNNTRTGGDGGQLTINTGRLTVRDGFVVSTEAIGPGNAGNVTVNASESVTVSGENNFSPSTISAGVVLVNPFLFPGASPELLIGNAGSITINSPVVRVLDGGLVQAVNDGVANGGTLQINADSIVVSDSELTTSTLSGEGGNILLNISNATILQQGGTIAAEAGGMGNGGNITINSETLTLLESSSITANAIEGLGGNIDITTQGLFISPDSSITASSQLGVDGVVAITEPEIDTSSALVQLSSDPIDPTTQIVSACSIARENSFVVTGNGGLPPDPVDDIFRGQWVWIDWQDPFDSQAERLSEVDAARNSDRLEEGRSQRYVSTDDDLVELVEANGWRIDANGNVKLVSHQSRNVPFLPSECLWER